MAIPKSIAWSKLDEADFETHHNAVLEFVRSDHFQRFLWPHMSPAQAHDLVESIFSQFERESV